MASRPKRCKTFYHFSQDSSSDGTDSDDAACSKRDSKIEVNQQHGQCVNVPQNSNDDHRVALACFVRLPRLNSNDINRISGDIKTTSTIAVADDAACVVNSPLLSSSSSSSSTGDASETDHTSSTEDASEADHNVPLTKKYEAGSSPKQSQHSSEGEE